MLQGDLDRLGDDVGAVGAAAEVLRTLIDGWDEGTGSRRLTVSCSTAPLG